MSSFNTKRTRSQLTLPALNHSTLGRSPLKDARSALRNATNLQVQLQLHRAPSKLRISTMDSDTDEDEILLSPNKKVPNKKNNKKRLSEECSKDGNGERVLKRSKMDPLPSLVLTSADTENIQPSPGPSQQRKAHLDNEQLATSYLELQRSRSMPPSPARSPPVPHLDLKTIPPSPWRSSSPAKNGSMLKPVIEPVIMEANTATKPPATPRIPAPAFSTNISQIQTPKGLHANLGMEPMSPLTPLPPTPALFGSGPIRAFTSGRREEVETGESWGLPTVSNASPQQAVRLLDWSDIC